MESELNSPMPRSRAPRRPRPASPAARRLLHLAAALLLAAPLLVAPLPASLPAAAHEAWYLEQLGIQEIWEETRGEGARVAVIDSGVDDSHPGLPELAGARSFGDPGTDGTEPIGAQNVLFHGTAVASVIAGNGQDGNPTGVAPEAELLSASVWLGGGGPDDVPGARDQVADAVRWAADEGADVINLSLGWSEPSWPESWDEAFQYAMDKDVLIIACVGNRRQGAEQAWSPSTMPGVLGVGGLDREGRLAPDASAPGTAVDLMGPGVQIPVAWHEGGTGLAEGSSFAAPIVAGVAALMRAGDPEASAQDIAARLLQTARPVPGHDGELPDAAVGHGRVDPPAAFASRATGSAETLGDLEAWVAMHRQAEPLRTEPIETPDEAGTDAVVQRLEPGRAEAAQRHAPLPVAGIAVTSGLLLAAVFTLVIALAARLKPQRAPKS
ncbi:S8 family peptidase [Sediminivirga luteola]|uniref:Peptidase S8/S53 domain-containing protein n=1 Tax=Sediminivirga luteola TaxID=1774748 RepID=A0A8J2TZ82_9MICO|nr:S8 family serine peptidase [Sediminivirga luteola]GGA18988.1 hypothetical protein GCM10011333_22670 [Sediminivirga luteola]